jgi:hypothetical protein
MCYAVLRCDILCSNVQCWGQLRHSTHFPRGIEPTPALAPVHPLSPLQLLIRERDRDGDRELSLLNVNAILALVRHLVTEEQSITRYFASHQEAIRKKWRVLERKHCRNGSRDELIRSRLIRYTQTHIVDLSVMQFNTISQIEYAIAAVPEPS